MTGKTQHDVFGGGRDLVPGWLGVARPPGNDQGETMNGPEFYIEQHYRQDVERLLDEEAQWEAELERRLEREWEFLPLSLGKPPRTRESQ